MTSFVAFLALVFAAPTTLAITPAIQAQQAALRGIQGVTGAQQQQQDSLFGAYPYGGFGLGHGLYNGLNRFGFHGLGSVYPYAADPTAQAATAPLLGAEPQTANDFLGGLALKGLALKGLGLFGLGLKGLALGKFGSKKSPHAADPADPAILTAAADPATQAILTAAADPASLLGAQPQAADSFLGGFSKFGLGGLGLRGLGFKGFGLGGFGFKKFPHAADPATQAILTAAADPATAILRVVQQQQQQAADPIAQAIAQAQAAAQSAADGYHKYKYYG